jgi:hypothetical protein
MKFLVLLFLASSLIANVSDSFDSKRLPVNKIQMCGIYEDSFLTSASVYEDNKNCYDLTYSILSFKQMLLSECPLDSDYVEVIYYLQKQFKKECE